MYLSILETYKVSFALGAFPVPIFAWYPGTMISAIVDHILAWLESC
jgi:hypothetical protein